MRVAVTGTTGRVGAALARHLSIRHEVIELPRSLCDLADSDSLVSCLEQLDCDAFINPAGITSLEACEDDPRLAMRVNAAAPGKIAIWAAERGVRVIHFSTDYVFGGDSAVLLTESDPARPVSAYGRSKLAGERAVLAHPGNLVLRVSWVFGPEKPSFIDQIHSRALAGEPLQAVGDKFSLPTCTADLAGWVDALLDSRAEGILHACNPGPPVSWHGMATLVVREMVSSGKLQAEPDIQEQKLDEMASFRAPRPRFTAMNTQRLAGALGGMTFRPWAEAIADHVRSLSAV